MLQDLESQMLSWIGEELANALASTNSLRPVPVKLLIMRLAMLSHSAGGDLTQSVELSLNAFDRASLFRVLRQLHRRGMIDLVDVRGQKLKDPDIQNFYAADASDKVLGFVKLTEPGAIEYKRIKLCEEPPPA